MLYKPTGEVSLHNVHPHCLALFFIVLANGAVYYPSSSTSTVNSNTYQPTHSISPYNDLSRRYEGLARAALSMESMSLGATCATVQTAFLMVRYSYIGEREKNEERWLLTGLTSRLAHMVSEIGTF